MIFPFAGDTPRIHRTAFVAPGAHVVGAVSLAAGSSIWFGAVLRGDMGAIRVGRDSNVQDGCVLHGDHGLPTTLGRGVIMGHQATAHACAIGDYTLIGIGARVLTGARVGKYCLIGAGALVLEGARIPDYSLVLGLPGKVVRRLSKKEASFHVAQAERYRRTAAAYLKRLG